MLKITLRNWFCWGDQVLDFQAPCSFVVGLNGSGKTSGVRDALEFAYLGTGELRGASSKKELAAVAIRDDLAECEVTVESHGIRIRRLMGRDGKQEVWRSTWEGGRWTEEEPAPLKRDQGDPFGNAPDDLVRCMLEPTHFYQLDAQRRQEILVQATSAPKVEREEVLAALRARLGSDDIADVVAVNDAATWVAASGFRSAEDAAIEQRREAKRDAAAIIPGEQPEPIFNGIDLAATAAADHQARLAELRVKHVEAVRLESAGAGVLAGKLSEAEVTLAELEASPLPAGEVEECQRRVAEKLKTWKALLLPEDPQPPGEDLRESTREQLEAAEQDLREAREGAEGAAEAVTALEDEEDDPHAYDRPAECPKGPAGMKCPVKPSVWKPAVAKCLGDPAAKETDLDRLRGELTQATERLEEATTAAETAVAAAAAAREPWDAFLEAREAKTSADQQEQTFRKVSEEADAALERAIERRRRQRDEDIGAAQARVESARQALEAAQGDEQPDGPSVPELEATIARGERIVEASKAYWREKAAWLERQEDLVEATAKVKRWDAICQELKPDGVETSLGGDAREAFMGYLEQAAGLSGEVFLDDACAITARVDREDYPRHPLQLSTSQRMAVGCALQHALCQLEGFPILVVDALDTFDAPHRSAWAQLAAYVALAERYPGAIVGCATITKDPQVPSEPWHSFWLKPEGLVVLGSGPF